MSKKKRHNRKREITPAREIPSWVCPVILGLLVVGTFLIRTIPSWSHVFVGSEIWFRGIDPWYHMRLVDNMMVNFPVPLQWDMLILFPQGMGVGYFPLMSWIIAGLGQVFNYEVVAVLLPPVLGALTLIPVYFICKTLWKHWVGLVACGLLMVLPTELFHRSLLGFVDHHILEVFFLANTILFLILLSKDRRLRWIILAGVSLGLYMSSWTGGLLLVAIIWVWFMATFMLRLRKGEVVDVLCKDMAMVFGIGLLLYLPNVFFIQGLRRSLTMFGLVTISPLVMLLASKVFSWRRLAQGLIGGVALVGVLAQMFIPEVFISARSIFWDSASTIQEVAPSTASVLWGHYGLSFMLFIGGLVYAIKRKENLLLIIFCVFTLILVLSQRRWSYYFVIGDAILAGYCLYMIASKENRVTKYFARIAICAVLVATIIPGTIGISRLPRIMSTDWHDACVWLKGNTPEIDGYYELELDKAEYGVLSWWDYGNWITKIGNRVPCSNPMNQHLSIQWQVLLAQSEEEANSYLDGIDYIMVDLDMVTNKLYAIVTLAPDGWEVGQHTFIALLWNEEADTWNKVHESGVVKVYARV